MSNGKSLEANLGLIENNAKVGAEISEQLARLRSSSGGGYTSSQYNPAT